MSTALYGGSGSDVVGRMLNDYLEMPLAYNRHIRDAYIFKKTRDHKRNWRGGEYKIPFEGSEASNYQSGGGLVPEADIQSELLATGTIPDYKELRSAIVFHERDLKQHGSGTRVPRDSFLKISIPRIVNKNRNRFSYLINHSILNGGAFVLGTPVKTSANIPTNGILTCDRANKLVLGQKVMIRVPQPSSGAWRAAEVAYVYRIDSNTKQVQFTKTRLPSAPAAADWLFGPGSFGNYFAGSSGNANLTGIAGMGIYNPGDETPGNGFTSLRSQVLPGSVTGGSSTLYGINKGNYPFLQSIVTQASSGLTKASAVVEMIFDHLVDFALEGQPQGAMMNYTGEAGDRTTKNMRMGVTIDCVMSYRWYTVFQKYQERKLGGNWPQSPNVKYFDAKSFAITAPDGMQLRFVAVESLRDDVFYFLGDDCTQYATLNYIWQSVSPDGNKWFTVRHPSNGLSYICDFGIYGDFILKRPAGAGAIYGLPSPQTITDFSVT